MKKKSTQAFCAQREDGWCKFLARDAEVTLEWCRGREVHFCFLCSRQRVPPLWEQRVHIHTFSVYVQNQVVPRASTS